MEESMASVINAFVDKGIDFSIIHNELIRVSLGDRTPWVIDIDGLNRRILMRLAVSIPTMRYPAVRKACRRIANNSGLNCVIWDGDVFLVDNLPADLPDFTLGPFCLLDVEIFKKTLDYAVPLLIYALESNWRDWAFIAHAQAYYMELKKEIVSCNRIDILVTWMIPAVKAGG